MFTFAIQVQSLNFSDTYLIDAPSMIAAIQEAYDSFVRNFPEPVASMQVDQTCAILPKTAH